MHPNKLRFLIFTCFFISGGTGLVYEVVWVKYLALIIGSTTAATTVVLATFMGGLALGNHILGKQADLVQNRLKLYGYLEIGIGLYCAISLQMINWGSDLYVSLARASYPPGPTVHLLRVIFAGIALLIPTMLMGGTLPVLARLWVAAPDKTAKGVASLYAINSFGAVVGSLIAGFFLIQKVGISLSILSAAAANILAGLIAVGLNPFVSTKRDSQEPEPEIPSSSLPSGPGLLPLALLGAFLSGAAAMVYEVGWLRLTALVWGSSTYSFTVMVAAFITGIAIGSVIARNIAGRRSDLFWIFGLCQLAVAISMLVTIPLYNRLPYSFARLGNLLVRTPETFRFYQVVVFLCSMSIMIIPTIFQGMALPLITQVASDQLNRLGRSVGRVFSLNTLGTLLGAILAGLVLMPIIGTRHTLEVGVAITLAAAAVVFLRDTHTSRRKRFAGLLISLLAVLFYYAFSPAWDLNVLNSGAFRRKSFHPTFEDYQKYVNQGKIIFQRDGADCSVAVFEWPSAEGPAQRILVVNGKADASTQGDLPTQLLTGHIPVILNAAAKDVLIVGLGSGITAGAVLQHGIRHLDVVEISKEVVEAEHFFSPYNNQALRDPRLSIIVDDAKTFLRTVPRTYDLIISEPSNPWISGIGTLFTEEFYSEVRKHLNPGGLFLQWVQGYEFSDDLFQTVVATCRQTFPHVSMWNTMGKDSFLLASMEPINIDLQKAAEEMGKPKVRESLQRVGISHLSTLLSLETMNSQTLAEFSKFALTNTDNFPVLEYEAPRAFFVGREVQVMIRQDDRLRSGRWDHLLLKKWLNTHGPLRAPQYEEIIRYQQRWGAADPFFVKAVLQEWVSKYPDQKEGWVALAHNSSQKDPTEEFRALERARFLSPEDPEVCQRYVQVLAGRFMEGVSLVGQSDPQAVFEVLDRCLSLNGSNLDLLLESKGSILSRTGKWNEAGESFSETARQRLIRTKGKNLSDVAGFHVRASTCFRLAGNKEKAILNARESLKLFSGNPRGEEELSLAEKMI